MAAFMRSRSDVRIEPSRSVPTIACPTGDVIDSDGEPMLTFKASMALLEHAGIAVAPYELIESDVKQPTTTTPEPLVVKLADVAHRTEHNAVMLGVTSAGLADAIESLRGIAARDGLPATVVVQPQLASEGEVFLGLTGETELGPVVAFGLGGVFVEVMRRIGGRIAPFTDIDAQELIAEFDDLGVVDGLRGARAWDRTQLGALLVKAGALVAGGSRWINSMDVNPLILTEHGFVAVDCVCFVKLDAQA